MSASDAYCHMKVYIYYKYGTGVTKCTILVLSHLCMSGNSSDSESSHGSQCDSEYNYIPEFIIEGESIDTSHEIGTLEAVDREILGDHDTCLYADEPLSDEEWYAQYLNKSAQHKEQNEMLQRRLDGLEDVTSW